MKRIARVALPVIFAISLVAAGSSATLAASKGGSVKPVPPVQISYPGIPPAN
jgi:uncharacterized membrane protein